MGGFVPSARGAQLVGAPADRLVVLWDRALATDPRAALQRPRVVALIAHEDRLEDRWSVCWILTSWGRPDGGLELAVHDPYGTALCAGTADPSWPEDGIVLRTVANHPGPCIEATLALGDGQLSVARLLQWPASAQKRQPKVLA